MEIVAEEEEIAAMIVTEEEEMKAKGRLSVVYIFASIFLLPAIMPVYRINSTRSSTYLWG